MSRDVNGRMRIKVTRSRVGTAVAEMAESEVRSKVIEFAKRRKTTDVAELHMAIRCDIRVLLDVVNALVSEGVLQEG